MKKVASIILVIAVILSFSAFTVQKDAKDKAHEIAEIARSMGLAEDNPIIVEAQRLWNKADLLDYTDDELIVATVIYNESANGCCEEHQLSVGKVVMSRVADGRFGGDTVYDVVCAPMQYCKGYANGNAKYAIPEDRLLEFIALARRAMSGEPYDMPTNVLYQDNKKHGTGVYKSYYSDLLGTWTYFCYG